MSARPEMVDPARKLIGLAERSGMDRDAVFAAYALEARIARLQALRDAVLDGAARAVYRGPAKEPNARFDAEQYWFRSVPDWRRAVAR
jgi:hypothetical protein